MLCEMWAKNTYFQRLSVSDKSERARLEAIPGYITDIEQVNKLKDIITNLLKK